VIHCISGQPDVIGRHLPGDDVIFHSYDQPVNQIGVVRISDLASLSKAIKELFRDSALMAAQRMVEGPAV